MFCLCNKYGLYKKYVSCVYIFIIILFNNYMSVWYKLNVQNVFGIFVLIFIHLVGYITLKQTQKYNTALHGVSSIEKIKFTIYSKYDSY